MSRFVSAATDDRVRSLIFGDTTKDECDRFLQQELVRYIPQLAGRTEQEILQFINYQSQVYLEGQLPCWGNPIASLNPTFVDSVDCVRFCYPDRTVYVRASIKENGYRMQLHLSTGLPSAFSRQFTRYDLRMFPELQDVFAKLPVMIGDAELVNRRHIHLAGFNRVEKRIPNATYWPRIGQPGLDEGFLAKYLSDPELFQNGQAIEDLELTLAFHGLFAIADPCTWDKPREVQMKHLISLCKLPIDYRRIDAVLDQLAVYIRANSLNARVAERQVLENLEHLKEYVSLNEKRGLEGTCIVQSAWNTAGKPIISQRGIKIKTYETIDCIVLGLYLENRETGLMEDNIKGVLVGLYDQALGVYLPVIKTNLDPDGVQVKGEEKKKTLTAIRRELLELIRDNTDPKAKIHTLYDTFLLQGRLVVKYLFGEDMFNATAFEKVLDEIPLRSDLISLWQTFEAEQDGFSAGTAKLNTVPRKFIAKHLPFFQAISSLDKKGKKRFFTYFSQAGKIRKVSVKLVKPQVLVNVTAGTRIIVELDVFDMKLAQCPYPAGWHSYYDDTFCFTNCYVKRVRSDKSITTPFSAVYLQAKKNTPK